MRASSSTTSEANGRLEVNAGETAFSTWREFPFVSMRKSLTSD